MRRRVILGIITAVAVAAIAVGLYVWLFPRAVTVAAVERSEVVATLVTAGSVEPPGKTTLKARVAARVTELAVEPGDHVGDGDILLKFDDREGQLDVERAHAAIEEGRARLQSVVDGGAAQNLRDLEQAQLELETAREEYDRARSLFDEGIAPRIDVDENRRRVRRAETEVERAHTALRESEVGGSRIRQAAAGVERAEAEARLARLQLERYTLRSPATGEVLDVHVTTDTAVQPGESLVTLVTAGHTELRIRPDERELARLEVGQPALVVADAFPDEIFHAEIHRIEPTVDAERGTIEALLRVEDPPVFLRDRMTVIVDIELDRSEDALVVPNAAVRDLATESPWVLVVDGRRARRVDVEIGLISDEYVEIRDGLRSQDLVITAPDVEQGQRVRSGGTDEARR